MKDCKFKVEWKNRIKQCNALRVEVLPSFITRCILKLPDHWPKGAKDRGGIAWLGSGGDPDVFGICDNKCPDIVRD